MVNGAATFDTGSAGLARFAQAASAAVVLSSDEAPVATRDLRVTNLAETLRYNSYEFSYRQDFGKIVLLRQEPETGELVQQFPSEYYLKKYAQSERVQREARETPSGADTGGDVVDVASAAPQSGGSAEVAGTGGDVVPSAPAVSSAPALPSASAGAARVDITI